VWPTATVSLLLVVLATVCAAGRDFYQILGVKRSAQPKVGCAVVTARVSCDTFKRAKIHKYCITSRLLLSTPLVRGVSLALVRSRASHPGLVQRRVITDFAVLSLQRIWLASQLHTHTHTHKLTLPSGLCTLSPPTQSLSVALAGHQEGVPQAGCSMAPRQEPWQPRGTQQLSLLASVVGSLCAHMSSTHWHSLWPHIPRGRVRGSR
jgi:hypothetical protein